jgi:hypothetical protein
VIHVQADVMNQRAEAQIGTKGRLRMNPFTSVSEVKPHTKILEIGPSSAGKTWDFFHLEGPRAAFDCEDGLAAYEDRFEFDLREAPELTDILGIVEDLLKPAAAEVLKSYRTIGFDGLTRFWHDALYELEDESGEIGFEDQRELKSPWKRLNSLIKQLGLRRVNVHAAAHAKMDWEVPRDGGEPKPKGMKGDFDGRIWEAFDLVLYRDREEDRDEAGNLLSVHYRALVLKSRYAHLTVGQLIRDWDPNVHLAPIFDRSQRKAAAKVGPAELSRGTDFAPATDAQKDELRDLCSTLGSQQRNGHIPDALAAKAAAFLKNGGSRSEAEELLKLIREIKQNVATAAAAT